MNSQTVTLNIPEPIYQRAKFAAKTLDRSLEDIIVETLRVVLPSSR